MSYKFHHHNQIAHILSLFDKTVLQSLEAAFAGGTLVSLTHGEHRLSRDIDFLFQNKAGYNHVRQLLASAGNSPTVFFASSDKVSFPREVRADMYGIRFPVEIEGDIIKVEFVQEARISLDSPRYAADIPVPLLSREDLISEKLLANADRWADTAVRSRDLVDLAAIRRQGAFPPSALAKAESAYPVTSPLAKAIQQFLRSSRLRDAVFADLQVMDTDAILDGLCQIARDYRFPVPECKSRQPGS